MANKVSNFLFYKTGLNPTITAGAYSAADQLGDEMVIDIGVADDAIHSALRLTSVVVIDDANQDDAMDILFFDRSVTPAADNAAGAFSDADLLFCLGGVKIVAGEYVSLAANSVATHIPTVPLTLKGQTGGGDAKIYAYAITRGTPTYVATDDLTFNFAFELHAE